MCDIWCIYLYVYVYICIICIHMYIDHDTMWWPIKGSSLGNSGLFQNVQNLSWGSTRWTTAQATFFELRAMQIIQLVIPNEVIARYNTLGQNLQHRLQRFLAFFQFTVATIDDVAKLHHLDCDLRLTNRPDVCRMTLSLGFGLHPHPRPRRENPMGSLQFVQSAIVSYVSVLQVLSTFWKVYFTLPHHSLSAVKFEAWLQTFQQSTARRAMFKELRK